jgi:glycosyltransferase involved in cell wall biosynthesis
VRIGIDARFLTHPQPGGFRTYTTHLVRALARVDSENEYVLYVDRPWSESTGDFPPNFQVRAVTATVTGLGQIWREQVLLARSAVRDRLDVFHAPALSAPLSIHSPLVVTVHDMIWYSGSPAASGGASLRRHLMWWYYRAVPQRAIRRAQALITVSRSAERDILDVFPFVRGRIFVTYEAAGSGFVPAHDPERVGEVRRRYGLPDEYIMAFGSADPRKNVWTLVDAYSRLPEALRARWPLVVIWAHLRLREAVTRQVEDLGLRGRVLLLRDVPDRDMPVLYNQARLFIFPSRQEGFGLPLLEAMASGTPVVAADNSSLPEVAGDAALLIDASDPDAMAGAVSCVLTDPVVRADLVGRGLARARLFSWERCARETLAAYCFACAPPASRVRGDDTCDGLPSEQRPDGNERAAARQGLRMGRVSDGRMVLDAKTRGG